MMREPLDDFEAAGFSEEVCEVCSDIQMECGVSSEALISLLRTFGGKTHNLEELT